MAALLRCFFLVGIVHTRNALCYWSVILPLTRKFESKQSCFWRSLIKSHQNTVCIEASHDSSRISDAVTGWWELTISVAYQFLEVGSLFICLLFLTWFISFLLKSLFCLLQSMQSSLRLRTCILLIWITALRLWSNCNNGKCISRPVA